MHVFLQHDDAEEEEEEEKEEEEDEEEHTLTVGEKLVKSLTVGWYVHVHTVGAKKVNVSLAYNKRVSSRFIFIFVSFPFVEKPF